MTREEFRKYIRENIVILDGATGTNLMAAGMPVGVCPEEWVMEHPQVILDLQKAYVDNGTNCITAKTIKDKRQRVKIEFSGTDSYQVISRYYNIEGKNYVMELEYMNRNHWIDDIPVLLQCLVNIQDRIKDGLD